MLTPSVIQLSTCINKVNHSTKNKFGLTNLENGLQNIKNYFIVSIEKLNLNLIWFDTPFIHGKHTKYISKFLTVCSLVHTC